MADLKNQAAAPNRIRNRELVQAALNLRKNGAGYEAIAKQINCSKSAAHRYVLQGLAELNVALHETAEEVRRLSLESLDVAKVQVMAKVAKGDLQAVQRLISLEERRAKLLGLDAPSKIAPTDSDGVSLFDVDAKDALRAKLGL